MPASLIIYCDESIEGGKYFSSFYGAALIKAAQRQAIDTELNELKAQLNLHGEIKWCKITANYADKYIEFLKLYFRLISDGDIKVRVMFTQNIHVPKGARYRTDNKYFLLYYQLIKHSFGLQHCATDGTGATISVYLDQVPTTTSKLAEFKRYLVSLNDYPNFSRSAVRFADQDITEVDSKQHVLMQGLDIILGSMQFRLNDKHKEKPAGRSRRSKRTVAKERVYKFINSQIRGIYPGFNIGVSTAAPTGTLDRWRHPYRHWRFVPAEYDLDYTKGKKK